MVKDGLWLAGLVVAGWLALTPMHAQAPVMAGQYQCEGTNPDGSPYRIALGVLGDGTKYQLTWQDPQGHFLGLGYVSGSTLSVAIATPEGQAVGLAVYTIAGQTLDGTWLAFGQAGTMTERCTPASTREAQ